MNLPTVLSRLSQGRAAVLRAALTMPLLLGMGFMQLASAGCLDVPGAKMPSATSDKSESGFGSARFVTAGFRQIWDDETEVRAAPIVGLWAFKYISEGNLKTFNIPDGAVVDGGVTTFYADGNEITYSGIRNPIVGAFCAGVWKRTGQQTYVLNHIGLSWDPTAASVSPPNAPANVNPGNPGGGPGAPGGPAFIKQSITLSSSHNSYTGTFTISNLLPDGKTPAAPAEIKGKIQATRISINTDTFESEP